MSHNTADPDHDDITISTHPEKRSRAIRAIVAEMEDADEGAPIDEVLDRAEESGVDREKGKEEIDRLQMWGTLYEPREDFLRVT